MKKKPNKCVDCGKEIYKGSTRCVKCSHIILGQKNKERYRKNPKNCIKVGVIE